MGMGKKVIYLSTLQHTQKYVDTTLQSKPNPSSALRQTISVFHNGKAERGRKRWLSILDGKESNDDIASCNHGREEQWLDACEKFLQRKVRVCSCDLRGHILEVDSGSERETQQMMQKKYMKRKLCHSTWSPQTRPSVLMTDHIFQ